MVVIDHQAFPHIFDAITEAASAEALLKVRQTGKSVRLQVDSRLYKHVVVYPRRAPHGNDSQLLNSSGPAFIVSTLATDEELGRSVILPASGLSATDVVDWFGCGNGPVPDNLKPDVVRRFSPNRVPLINEIPQAGTYVDFISDQEAVDHMYENLSTPNGATAHVIHHNFDVSLNVDHRNIAVYNTPNLTVTVVMCPEVGTSPWKPGPVVDINAHINDLLWSPTPLWASILARGGTVTIVGFERVIERLAEARNTTVSLLHLERYPASAIELARTFVEADLHCEPNEIHGHMKRFNYMGVSQARWSC